MRAAKSSTVDRNLAFDEVTELVDESAEDLRLSRRG